MKRFSQKKTASKTSKSSKKTPKSKLRPFKKIVKKLKSRIAAKSLKIFELSKASLEDAFKGNGERISDRPEAQAEPQEGLLPNRYGDNQLTLMVRDPWWIYAYWEVTPEKEREVLSNMQKEGQFRDRKVLRVYDITGSSIDSPNFFFDIEVGDASDNWYIEVGQPDKEWVTELGWRSANGRFYALLRSNPVRTPRYGVSDVIDEEWMLLEEFYWKIFGISGGIWGPKSSWDVREILARYLRSIRALESGSGMRLDSRLAHGKPRADEESQPIARSS